jgi:hypothetical protein
VVLKKVQRQPRVPDLDIPLVALRRDGARLERVGLLASALREHHTKGSGGTPVGRPYCDILIYRATTRYLDAQDLPVRETQASSRGETKELAIDSVPP